MKRAGLQERCFLELKSVLLEVGYIKKWPKLAYLELKVPHLKFRVMRDRAYKNSWRHCVCLSETMCLKPFGQVRGPIAGHT